jgi:pyruvate carboxylase
MHLPSAPSNDISLKPLLTPHNLPRSKTHTDRYMSLCLQCRVTCEDPSENFKPDNGRLEAYRLPGGPGIRLDGAVAAGNVISRYYGALPPAHILTYY